MRSPHGSSYHVVQTTAGLACKCSDFTFDRESYEPSLMGKGCSTSADCSPSDYWLNAIDVRMGLLWELNRSRLFLNLITCLGLREVASTNQSSWLMPTLAADLQFWYNFVQFAITMEVMHSLQRAILHRRGSRRL